MTFQSSRLTWTYLLLKDSLRLLQSFKLKSKRCWMITFIWLPDLSETSSHRMKTSSLNRCPNIMLRFNQWPKSSDSIPILFLCLTMPSNLIKLSAPPLWQDYQMAKYSTEETKISPSQMPWEMPLSEANSTRVERCSSNPFSSEGTSVSPLQTLQASSQWVWTPEEVVERKESNNTSESWTKLSEAYQISV